MKAKDVLLERWKATLAEKANDSAILNTRGESVYNFKQIEDRACDFESKLRSFQPGTVLAVQIGNHEDWPSILIECLRSQVVVLPIEQSINDQQRDAAMKICRVSAILEKAGSLREIDNQPPKWDGKMPSLLKLTS